MGYMAENFADFGFPGMLVGIAVIGFLIGGCCRYFMVRKDLPWMVREGTVVVLVYLLSPRAVLRSPCRSSSAPKVVMTLMLVYMAVARFAYPYVLDLAQTARLAGPRRTSRRFGAS